MTIIDELRLKKRPIVVDKIALDEHVAKDFIKKGILAGHMVIPKNRNRLIQKPCGIGKGLSVKVNVNLGTSPDFCDLKAELDKLKVSLKYGADTVMDLSVGKRISFVRQKILELCVVPLGTVPIYEVAVGCHNDLSRMKASDMLDVLKKQAKEGVDFFTIHAGINRSTSRILGKAKRQIPIVSRGGAILFKWMKEHNQENPYYEFFDEVLDIAKEYDITLSLGDGMRPGSISDASDSAQFGELHVLGDLQKRAFKKGVQTMIEGPGHVPMDQIEKNIKLQKKICHGAPFYVLGPLVTDISPGYDHITGAIGGAMAAWYGADFLCYLTPAEHLRLPDLADVREGLIASKIAAHAADIAKGYKHAKNRDMEISKARARRDWKRQFELALDTDKCREYRKHSTPDAKDVCSMCGNYCPIKLLER